MSQTNNGSQSPLVQSGPTAQAKAEPPKEPTAEEQISRFIDGDGKTAADKEDKSATKDEEAVETKEETAEDADEITADADESVESDAGASEDEEKPVKKKKTAEERISELTAKRREAERSAKAEKERSAALEERLNALEGKKSTEDLTTQDPEPTSELKAPDPADKKYEYGEFDTQYRKDYEDYLRQSLRSEIKKEQETERKKAEETRQAEAAAAKQQELGAKLQAHQESGIKEFDDFEDALEALGEIETPIAPETTAMLLESEACPKILYHLGKNPKEAAEIASKSPIEQARYIGKLEARFSADTAAPQEKPKAKAPQAQTPPTRARGSGGQFKADDATNDFNAFKSRHAGKGM